MKNSSETRLETAAPVHGWSAGLSRELYIKSGAEALGLGLEAFAGIILGIVAKFLPAESNANSVEKFCCELRLQDLALAHACAAGHERAWEAFMVRYRSKLYDMASAIARESSAARELADGLYAELYGTSLKNEKRISKLSSYNGRGSLDGWLRTVLAQEFVNRYRKQRRLVSLEEETEAGQQFASPQPESQISADSRMEIATDEALAGLSPDDRFLLAAYYLDQRTLAEIALALQLHESTISRKLHKLTKTLRKQVLAGLKKSGMSRRQAEEALQVDVRDLKVDLRKRLTQEGDAAAFHKQKVQEPAG